MEERSGSPGMRGERMDSAFMTLQPHGGQEVLRCGSVVATCWLQLQRSRNPLRAIAEALVSLDEHRGRRKLQRAPLSTLEDARELGHARVVVRRAFLDER